MKGLPVGSDRRWQGIRKGGPKTSEPMGPLSLGEHVPFILFTGISAVVDFLGTSLHRLHLTKRLFRVVIPYRKEEIPAEGELFLPRALEKTVIGGLDRCKGGDRGHGKPLLF